MDFSTKSEVLLHPARARIYAVLCEGPRTVRELNEVLNDLPQASTYRHLNLLRNAGLVEKAVTPDEAPREARYVAAAPEPLFNAEQRERLQPNELVNVVHALTEVLRARFSRFSEVHPFPLKDGDVSCMVRPLRLTPEELTNLRTTVQELVERSESREPQGLPLRTIGFFAVPDTEDPDA